MCLVLKHYNFWSNWYVNNFLIFSNVVEQFSEFYVFEQITPNDTIGSVTDALWLSKLIICYNKRTVSERVNMHIYLKYWNSKATCLKRKWLKSGITSRISSGIIP